VTTWWMPVRHSVGASLVQCVPNTQQPASIFRGSTSSFVLGGEGRRQMERQLRVLIADDRHTTRQGLRALLALLPQVEVIGEATDGGESIRLVSEYQPDVVLMDMQMPVMDGVEATRRIKKQWPEVRVIVLTMYARYRAEALAAGADAFLLKDGAADTLAGAILAHVQASSGQPAAP
jgi:CheY-like chemotaxis protein